MLFDTDHVRKSFGSKLPAKCPSRRVEEAAGWPVAGSVRRLVTVSAASKKSSDAQSATVIREGVLLLRQWRDAPDGIRLELWAGGAGAPLHVTLTRQRALMFVDRAVATEAGERRNVDLVNMDGDPVDVVYFTHQRDLLAERERLIGQAARPHEADVKPVERFLMERFILGGLRVTGPPRAHGGVLHFVDPQIEPCDVTADLAMLSMDIETDGFDGPLLSIAGVSARGDTREERVFLIGGGEVGGSETVGYHADAASLLDAFLAWVSGVDPDVIVGWNVIEFDLAYLERLCHEIGRPFTLGRDGGGCEILEPRSTAQPHIARVPGRVVLDGIATLRNATFSFESFALDDVARDLLGRGKKIATVDDRVEEIRRMAREDPAALAEYNLEDCRLVLDVFAHARLVDFAVERQSLTGLPMDRQGGSVAAFDQLYLPRLHRRGRVAPSVGLGRGMAGSPGGYVMESVPGLFRNVVVFDFKSLYPSIIRTFLVDPLGMADPGDDPVEGYDGGRFARDGHILPGLIGTLWSARDEARRESNGAMSQAIKILMNSFYGVLGTPGCRFFDHRLVNSITRRGHEIITRSRDFLRARNLAVIYGDTDSLFVHLDESLDDDACAEVGASLVAELNAFWREEIDRVHRVESFLELEHEAHYRRFLMPTMRGSDRGSKKRYAGLVLDSAGAPRLVFKGLEVVRTDWTPLAREFQRELVRRVFTDEPYEEYVAETVHALRAGELDAQLVYRKRLRRNIDEYVKNVPPHVQAARKLAHAPRVIEYCITRSGPEPLAHLESAIDYEHYVRRQLEPAADTILYFLDTSLARIAGRQMSLF